MNALTSQPALTPVSFSISEDGAYLHAPRTAGRWPSMSLRWGRFEAEIDSPLCGFLRMGKLESYARWEDDRAWFWQRDAGALEISAGRYRVTISRRPEV